MSKNLLSFVGAASILSGCVGPQRDYVETQLNFVGVPVKACVEKIPPCQPDLIGIEPDRYGKLLRLEAKEQWEKKEKGYREGYTHESGW